MLKKYKLGEICEISSSKRIYAKEYKKSGVPFFRSKEIIKMSSNTSFENELFISREKYDEIKEKYGVPKKNDILLTSVGTLGIPYLVNEKEFYFKDGNLTWFRNFNNNILHFKFLYWWFKTDEGLFQIKNKCIGSTQKALPIKTLENFEITLPSIDKQKKIVNILDGIDQKLEINNEINNN